MCVVGVGVGGVCGVVVADTSGGVGGVASVGTCVAVDIGVVDGDGGVGGVDGVVVVLGCSCVVRG